MIVVAGGGITGLATGFELHRTGADVLVLEASDRPGGVIRSDVVEGRVLDWGPQRARMTPSFRRLVQAVGLDDEVVTAPPDLDLYIYRDGRLRRLPFSLAAFAGADVVSFGGKLRGLAEVFSSEARPEESVSEFFTRKFGKELYETIIGPLYGGLYASDPADMRVGLSLIHVLREFRVGRSLLAPLLRRGGRIDPPPPCNFRGGMQALPDALARALGGRLRTNSAVEDVRPAPGGWTVRASTGETVQASHVVLATPAPVTSKLLASTAPAAATAIGGLRYNALAVVHLEAETPLQGIGFKVAFSENALSLTGVTFNDHLFARPGVYTAYLGGARHPEVEFMDDGEVGRTAVRDFRTTTGHDARVLSVAREHMPAWDNSWEALSGIEIPHGIDVAGNWWSRPGLPGRLAEAARLAKKLSPSPRSDVVSQAPS